MKTNQPRLSAALLRFAAAALLLGGVGILFFVRAQERRMYDAVVIPPTCTAGGYTQFTHKQTGAVHLGATVPPLGHTFSDPQTVQEGDRVSPALLRYICTVCGAEEQKAAYPDSTFPRLSLYGSTDGIGKTQEVSLLADFSGEGHVFSGYVSLKHQGHSSLQYSKKNYTIKFYTDRAHAVKNKLTFSHWNAEHKYILKANYNDPSHCRNVICADVWAEMVQSRAKVPRALTVLSNYGAADGFPVSIYLNDTFHGLYTLTLHKDDDLFGMEDGKKQALLILNNASTQEAYFRAETSFALGSPWEIEFCGTEDTDWVKTKLNSLITFLRNSDEDTFRRNLSRYLDVDAAIDYLIALYALGLPAHAAEDLLLVCYSPDDAWICSHYDMHDAFSTGESSVFLPRRVNGTWDSATDSLLWDRILNTFFEDICRRYAVLRRDILQPEKIGAAIDAYIAQIPAAVYTAEAAVNGTAPFTEDTVAEMHTFLQQQIAQLDEAFAYERMKK